MTAGTSDETRRHDDVAAAAIEVGHAQSLLHCPADSSMSYADMTDRVDFAIDYGAPAPSRTPPKPDSFVNRNHELELLTDVSARSGDSERPTIVVLSGTSGVGKTAIAMQWAHVNRSGFDTKLYADLETYRQRGGVDVSDVLDTFLRELGTHHAYVPAELSERVAMFQARTAATRLLVVLDNVDQPAEVRPLLPGSAASVVIVTSQRRLSGLLMEGAKLVEMRPMSAENSSTLMADMLPEGDAETEVSGLREFTELCAGLPVALRVAGARLLRHRPSAGGSVRRSVSLSWRRGALSLPGKGKVEAVFDMSYLGLPRSVQKVYCCMGLHPGPDFSADLVAAAVGDSVDSATRSLDTLMAANLVEAYVARRYRLHDLVRLHARQRAEHDLTADTRTTILRRIADWYLRGAAAADRQVMGKRWRLAVLDSGGWRIDFDPASAMIWLEAERANLLAVAHAASRNRWFRLVWQLCEALWALYHSRKYYTDWVEIHRLGVEAARADGNLAAEARMRNQLARAYQELGEFRQASRELAEAFDVAVESRNRRAEAAVLESQGLVERDRQDYSRAVERLQRARAINAEIGNPRGVALQEYQLGDVLVRSQQPAEAVTVLNRSLATLDTLDDEMTMARVRIVLGNAYRLLGRDQEALDQLTSAIAVTKERRQPVKEAQALEVLVRLVDRQRMPQLFETSARRLRDIYRENGNPRSVIVEDWLTRGGLQ